MHFTSHLGKMNAVRSIFLMALFCILSIVEADDLQSFEHMLHDELLKNRGYNPFQRPVKNSSQVVRIEFDLSLIKLFGVDERKQQMTTLVWISQHWKDQYLTWEPSDYGGVASIRFPSSEVWKPDVKLYNGVGKQDSDDVLVSVRNTGDVFHIPPVILTSMCPLDLTDFPFDEQTCTLKFGSWTYDDSKVVLNPDNDKAEIDLTNHVEGPEWSVIGTSVKVNHKVYSCCPEIFSDVTFNVTLRRKTAFYHYVFATPAVMLALLTPVLFLLPSDDTGKFPLGGTLLVSIAVLYNLIQDQLPMGHNTVPVIGIYYSVVFLLISLSLAISAITNNIANRATRLSQPPKILKVVLLSCLGRLLCVPFDSNYGVGTTSVSLDEGDNEKQESFRGKGQGDWRLMAMVLDRIFFLIFLVIVIIASLILLA